jgi:hypothetical protein
LLELVELEGKVVALVAPTEAIQVLAQLLLVAAAVAVEMD